jgi:hypothetical protein
MDEPRSDEVSTAYPPEDAPHGKQRLRRFAGAIGDCYRTMDPHVSQVIASPGVLNAAPAESDEG